MFGRRPRKRRERAGESWALSKCVLLQSVSSYSPVGKTQTRKEAREHPPGSVLAGLKEAAAGLRGVRWLKAGPVEEGSSGTVGRPGGERGGVSAETQLGNKQLMQNISGMSDCVNPCVCMCV